jgi:hypothetical protein
MHGISSGSGTTLQTASSAVRSSTPARARDRIDALPICDGASGRAGQIEARVRGKADGDQLPRLFGLPKYEHAT